MSKKKKKKKVFIPRKFITPTHDNKPKDIHITPLFIGYSPPSENNCYIQLKSKKLGFKYNNNIFSWNCQEMCSQKIPKILDGQKSGGVMSQPS